MLPPRTFTLKVVSESRVTWVTFVPILVFLGLSVLDVGPMYAANVRHHHRLMPQLGLGADA